MRSRTGFSLKTITSMIIYTRATNTERFFKTDFSTQLVETVYVSKLFPTVERCPISCTTSYGVKYTFVTEDEYQASRTQALILLDILPAPVEAPAEALVLTLATVSVEELNDLPF